MHKARRVLVMIRIPTVPWLLDQLEGNNIQIEVVICVESRRVAIPL
jgi:hypothetical protein